MRKAVSEPTFSDDLVQVPRELSGAKTRVPRVENRTQGCNFQG